MSEPKLRGDIEAWLRGIESGVWNPTQATKRRVALVLREFLARVAVVRPTRDSARTIYDAVMAYYAYNESDDDDCADATGLTDAILSAFGVAVSDSQETPTKGREE